MKKELALKEIAQTGYNIGYAAKKHLATYDIVEKAPGWISIISFAVGILALVVPAFEHKVLAASFLIVAYAVFYFNSYQEHRGRYADVGSRLTTLFTTLRALYYEASSRNEGSNVEDLMTKYHEVLAESQQIGISKQVFLSDWYAHYKFFWQAQTDWLDAELRFGFWRDRVPLSATLTGIALIVASSGWALCAGGWMLCA